MWSITMMEIDYSQTVIHEGTQVNCLALFNLYDQWNGADKDDRPAWVVPDLIISSQTAKGPGRWGEPVELISPSPIIAGTVQ